MKQLIFIIILFLIITTTYSAQPDKDTIIIQDIEKYYCESDRIDSLLLDWYYYTGRDTLSFFELYDKENLILNVPDSVIKERIKNIATPIDLAYNRLVQNYVDRYVNRGEIIAPRLLGRSIQYFPVFEKYLDVFGLPLELKYLPAIESALNTNAVSRAGATGLWQIMYRTGLMLGLEINSYVDERRDPEKSTIAACMFLKQLYETYQCWNLALAAYNCGPGRLNGAIRRSGGETNYWKLLPYLPRETRNYVSAFIAVTYLFSYYEDHNYKPEFFDFIDDYDTVMITQQLHFAQIDSVLGISINELRELNPMYRKDIVPAKQKAYPLKIRREYLTDFIRLEDSIYNYMDSVFFSPERFNYDPKERITRQVSVAPQPSGTAALKYTVKTGDAIGLIAQWYGVSVSNLRAWNGISGNLIRAGQTLNVYVPESSKSKYEQINQMSFEEKQKMIGVKVEPKEQTDSKTVTGYKYYTVKRGDSPWIIASRFSGVSVEEILQVNGLNSSSTLNVGDRLKIPIKE